MLICAKDVQLAFDLINKCAHENTLIRNMSRSHAVNSFLHPMSLLLSFFSRFFHRCLSQSLPSIHIIYGYHKLFHHVTDIYLSFLESWILIA